MGGLEKGAMGPFSRVSLMSRAIADRYLGVF